MPDRLLVWSSNRVFNMGILGGLRFTFSQLLLIKLDFNYSLEIAFEVRFSTVKYVSYTINHRVHLIGVIVFVSFFLCILVFLRLVLDVKAIFTVFTSFIQLRW